MTEARPPLTEDSRTSSPPGTMIAAADAPPVAGEIAAKANAEAPLRRVLSPRNYVWLAGAALAIFLALRYLALIPVGLE